ncbi:MAG: DUF2249 domain-containing protein [Rhodocyclaceae bacterium]|nr:DUF2249 domain-containing protein [Rhodocyclaceae bacterium]
MLDPIVVDARGLPPPEPMERTLSALDDLVEGQEVLLLLYREPFPLYGILQRNGYAHRVESTQDGTFQIYIRRAT